ncbi:acyltransferase [Vagococcus coleopterorum]|uniref:Acyltransferase n=1 Tax=Vagococcus coleopterorum TaxID=2714946 RepID=A0A6G8ANX4_9ENTE|nr:acyltransferase family protein [Vagococcus coleopterorum]QIL46623.1 acyltransferase [Vagococcus coleopterorum]
MTKPSNHTNYLPSIDGLRALAIIFVLIYHFKIPFFTGGFIGVDIFFVLSGYLITSKLLSEWRSHQKIDLKRFWVKRVRRLIPAVAVLLAVVLLVCFFLYPKVFEKSWLDGVASFFYVSNWWYIFNDVPYFQTFGIPSPFKHLWSLAIEEQFYLIWPIAFATLLKWLKKRQHVLKAVLVSGLLSIGLMWVLYNPESIDRVYYGTDTRLFTLAFGCSLAFIWPFYLLEDNFNTKEKRIIDSVGVVSLLGLITLAFVLSEYKKVLYPGGFVLVGLLATLLLATIVHPSSRLGKVFSHPWLIWLGKRSYSIYLWHYPILVLTTPVKTIGTLYPLLMLLQLALIILAADMSYRFIELPFIRHGFRGTIKLLKSNLKRIALTILKYILPTLILSTSLFVYSDFLSKGKFFFEKTKETTTVTETTETETKPAKKEDITKVLALGDSVLLGAKEDLEEKVPGIVVDGVVGRQLVQASDLIKEKYSNYNDKESVVFIELGSNSTFEKSDLNALLKLLNKAHVYIVNTRVPRDWEKEVNKMLEEASQSHSNVQLIDWYSVAKSHPEILGDDGIHLTDEGIPTYADLYVKELNHYNLNLGVAETVEKE